MTSFFNRFRDFRQGFVWIFPSWEAHGLASAESSFCEWRCAEDRGLQQVTTSQARGEETMQTKVRSIEYKILRKPFDSLS